MIVKAVTNFCRYFFINQCKNQHDMINDSPFSREQSLLLINEMIGKAKRSYTTKGIASMVWGALIILCSMVTWVRVKFNWNIGFDIWSLLLIAMIFQIYFSIRERKDKNFVGHDEQTMAYVWGTFSICIFITSFYNNKFDSESSTTLIMMLYGIPTFITGGIFKFKPLIIGGIICWVLSIVSIYTSFATDILLMSTCGLCGWWIPGMILWNNYKKGELVNV